MIHLLSPGDPARPTGGFRYNARLVSGLRALGEAVTVHVLEAAWPDPGEPVHIELPAGEPVIVDELLCCGVRLRCGPTVGLLHSPLFAERPRREQTAWRERERAVLAGLDALVVTSPLTASALGVVATVVPPGVEAVPEGPVAIPAEPERHELLAVGHLMPRKGQDLLLEALARLVARTEHRVRLRLVGGPADAAFAGELAARVREEALPVELVGPTDDVTPAYRSSQLLVHAARFEAWGMVIDEALSHGIPVLSTPAGALARAGRAALRVPAGDAEALARALARWCGDAALRASTVEASRRLELPGWLEVAVAWKSLLDELRETRR